MSTPRVDPLQRFLLGRRLVLCCAFAPHRYDRFFAAPFSASSLPVATERRNFLRTAGSLRTAHRSREEYVNRPPDPHPPATARSRSGQLLWPTLPSAALLSPPASPDRPPFVRSAPATHSF